ncbi:transposase [Salmonella enterica]|uniref:Transposase n=3 Tax=Salmonella enterica TaxID=28901 RepID=A0A3J8WUB8_SALER|nr:transposase [Salmonella enterica subsp. houtenae]EAA7386554.1 transposase [Salmonella enterica subsp. enterica]EAB2654178.1 transposase [Salmonella enterica]EAU5132283.1 transposase [Salmonella enterica subsp. enterica serovar Oranienburg]EBQ5984894.1 transposase [Salmonella enterica subsp. houtenae serovar Houten]ECT3981851.1 transposase [Salmonella enterica subsp. houtenae serovar 53:z4,z23:-]PNO35352.1 transposase [Salmonella enterica subsp. houtenae serovar 50:g,z51:-]HAC6521563.1 tra
MMRFVYIYILVIYGSYLWFSLGGNMFTINSTNRVASTIAPYACVSDVNLEDKATFLTSAFSDEHTSIHAYDSSLQCFVLNDQHVPQNTLATDVEGYNRGLQERISLEYQPLGSIVFLLGTPAVLETKESLSLPVSPDALTQKLLSISSNDECKLSGSTSCTTPASHNPPSGYIAQYRHSAEVFPDE